VSTILHRMSRPETFGLGFAARPVERKPDASKQSPAQRTDLAFMQ
jgi:hypothetical protein